MLVFNITYSSLEEELILRAKDKLHAVNILKRRLIELHLKDKREEADHILFNATLHEESEKEIKEDLSAISEIHRVSISEPNGPQEPVFIAISHEDSTYYSFVFNDQNRQVTLVFRFDDIQNILLERTGLGISGESYIVNEQHKLMSTSLFYPGKYPTSIYNPSKGVLTALNGEEGVSIYDDYRSKSVMGAYRHVEFFGLKLALLTEVDLDELMEPIYTIRWKMIVLAAILLIVSLLSSIVLGRVLSVPIVKLRKVADQLSTGSLPSDVTPVGSVLEMHQITLSMDKLIHSLQQIASFASDIGKGNMDSEYVMLSDKDDLGNAILSMREQLVQLNNEKKAIELSSKRALIDAQEKDRERISRDLHDGLGALLTTLKLRMEKNRVLENNLEIKDLVERAIAETRSLARNLMPSVLRDFGLNEALEQLISDVESSSQIKILFFNELKVSEPTLQKDQQVSIYRVIQEAFNNAVKHANCQEMQLSLTVFDDRVAVFVKDNGTGFDVSQKAGFKGLGLKNIEERVRLMNGIFEITSNSSGTILEIEIPIV